MAPEQLLLIVLVVAILGLILLVGYLIGSVGRARRSPRLDGSAAALPPGLESLAPAFQTLQGQLSTLQGQFAEAQGALAVLREEAAIERERRPRDDQAYEALQRLSATLLGSARAGAAGERLVAEALGALPPQWQVTNHLVGNKRVEFAINLPDGLILPIDSKVVAQTELDGLERATSPAERDTLERRIRSQALSRASEVRQYVDPRTPGFAIAAVSDAVYQLCGPILPIAYKEHQALIVPYSLLTPFVLMVYEQHRRGGMDLDAARVANLIADAEAHLEKASQALNGHLGGALVQISNARDSLSRELGEAVRALSLVRSSAAQKVRG